MGSLLNIGGSGGLSYGSGQRGLSSPRKYGNLGGFDWDASCNLCRLHEEHCTFFHQPVHVRSETEFQCQILIDFTCQSWELVFSFNGSTRTGSRGNMAWSIAWTAAKAPELNCLMPTQCHNSNSAPLFGWVDFLGKMDRPNSCVHFGNYNRNQSSLWARPSLRLPTPPAQPPSICRRPGW